MDQGDEEGQQRIPITEVREWGDPGLNELIIPYTEPAADRLNLNGAGNENAAQNNIVYNVIIYMTLV